MTEKKPEKEEPKRKLIDAENLLDEMEELERFNGSTERKITDNWYELKRRVAGVLTAQGQEDDNSAE